MWTAEREDVGRSSLQAPGRRGSRQGPSAGGKAAPMAALAREGPSFWTRPSVATSRKAGKCALVSTRPGPSAQRLGQTG